MDLARAAFRSRAACCFWLAVNGSPVPAAAIGMERASGVSADVSDGSSSLSDSSDPMGWRDGAGPFEIRRSPENLCQSLPRTDTLREWVAVDGEAGAEKDEFVRVRPPLPPLTAAPPRLREL
jgi:hypothetical protein